MKSKTTSNRTGLTQIVGQANIGKPQIEMKGDDEATDGGKEVYDVASWGRKDRCVSIPKAEAPDSANISLRKTERNEA